MNIALGLDFGGTKVLAGVIDLDTGKILATAKKRTDASDDAKQLVARLIAVSTEAVSNSGINKSDLLGIGVGIAGQIDAKRGILLAAPNISQSAVNLPVASLIGDHFGVPARLGNDVQVAALGETKFGAGKGNSDFVCVFVGTGIGGAIVRQGKVVTGAGGAAGEIGHVVVDANGRLCGCGGRGHLEAYASRTAITKALIGEMRLGRPTMLRELLDVSMLDVASSGAIRSGVLVKALEAGDDLARDIVNEAAVYLGYGLATVINLLNPSRIILGGGVIEAIDDIAKIAERTARRESLGTSSRSVDIVTAALGDNAGIVGAALLNLTSNA